MPTSNGTLGSLPKMKRTPITPLGERVVRVEGEVKWGVVG